jgi:hypothetical protein
VKLHVTFTSHYKNELKWSAISLKPSIYTQFMWAKIEARHKSHVLACLHRESALNTGFTRCVSVSAFSRTRLLFWKLANLAALLEPLNPTNPPKTPIVYLTALTALDKLSRLSGKKLVVFIQRLFNARNVTNMLHV